MLQQTYLQNRLTILKTDLGLPRWRRVREALSKWKRDVIAALTKAVLVGGTDRP